MTLVPPQEAPIASGHHPVTTRERRGLVEQLQLLGRAPTEAELQIRNDQEVCDELTRLMAGALEAIYRLRKGASDGLEQSQDHR